jgi:hypothetical protein
VCYVVTSDKTEPPDLGYLDAAAFLALDIAKQKDGVVVDRTSDIGYPLRAFERLREEGMRVRDAVSLEETSGVGGVTLRTHGMVKYGQSDFLLEHFPFEHLELGRRLLYDNVCDYSAFRAPVLAGQTMGSSDYRLFFEGVTDGLLRITDCDPEKKAPLPGISRLLGSLLPIWETQKQKESAQSEAQAKRARAGKKKVAKARSARKAAAKGRRKEKRTTKAAAKSREKAKAKNKSASKAKPSSACPRRSTPTGCRGRRSSCSTWRHRRGRLLEPGGRRGGGLHLHPLRPATARQNASP